MMHHINPKTGRVNICRASRGAGQCPFGKLEDHYSTKEEARRAYEKTQVEPPPLSRKPRVTVTGESGRHNLYRGLPKRVRPKFGEYCDLNYFTERDADEFFRTWERPFRTDTVAYPREEKEAINYYQMKGFSILGEHLRGDSVLQGKSVENLANLKKALGRGKTIQPLTIFRGLKGDYALELSKLKPGDTIYEPSFSSTSPSEKRGTRLLRSRRCHAGD